MKISGQLLRQLEKATREVQSRPLWMQRALAEERTLAEERYRALLVAERKR